MSRGLRALIGRLHPRFAVVAHDLFMVWLAWSGAMWVRYSIEPATDGSQIVLREVVT